MSLYHGDPGSDAPRMGPPDMEQKHVQSPVAVNISVTIYADIIITIIIIIIIIALKGAIQDFLQSLRYTTNCL